MCCQQTDCCAQTSEGYWPRGGRVVVRLHQASPFLNLAELDQQTTENWLLHWVCKEVAGTLRSHFHIQWWAIIQLLVALAPCLACSGSGALRPLCGVLSVLFLSPFSCALWAHVLQPHGSTGLSLSEPLSSPTFSSKCSAGKRRKKGKKKLSFNAVCLVC